MFHKCEKLRSQTSVIFSSDRPQLFDAPAHPRLYGCLPSAVVATNNGWKSVINRANHCTGKAIEVMQAWQQAISATQDYDNIKKFRRTMVQIANEKMNGNTSLCDAHEVQALINTDASAPHMPMVNTVTAAQLHSTCCDLTTWMINATRTPPAGGAKAKY